MEDTRKSPQNTHLINNFNTLEDNPTPDDPQNTPNTPMRKQKIILDYDKESGYISEYLRKGYIYKVDEPGSPQRTDVKYISNAYYIEPYNTSAVISQETIDGAELRMWYNLSTGQAYFIGVKVEWEGKEIKNILYCKINKQVKMSYISDNGTKAEIPVSNEHGKILDGFIFEDGNNKILYVNDGQLKAFDGGLISPEDQQLTGTVPEEVYFVDILPDNVECIVKKDVYLTNGSVKDELLKNVTFTLDGGNVYRYHNTVAAPDKIECKDGAFIDVPSKTQIAIGAALQGAQYTCISNANENCSLSLFGGQNNVVVEFNPMDFVHREDYTDAYNNAASLNLSKVLERIFSSIYNRDSLNQRMVIKMPETHFGTTNFYLERPLVIPHNVTLDMSGATVLIPWDFDMKIREKNVDGLDVLDADSNPGGYTKTVDYIFAFGTNSVLPILATSVIKNMIVIFDNGGDHDSYWDKDKNNRPHKVFDLTNFKGIMEGVEVHLNGNTDTVVFWQPFGNWTIAYSDQKIIRRCKVHSPGWRTETPTAIFCTGDGCIIEQSILGFVAIIGGNGYTITGCLNDSYFLYDTAVDFSGCYWEMGQFQILDSRVTFSDCVLVASNNQFKLSHDTNDRYFMGPWMAIDTDGCRAKLKNFIHKHGLNELGRFNEVSKELEDENGKSTTVNSPDFIGKIAKYSSIVKFNETVKHNNEFWGYRQPMASPLIMKGEGAEIVGIENLENIDYLFMNDDAKSVSGTTSNKVLNIGPLETASILPLVNGDFSYFHADMEVPESVVIFCGVDDKSLVPEQKYGADWNGEIIKNIRVRFVLDRQRNLYSKEYAYNGIVSLIKGKIHRITIMVDMAAKEYSDLDIELMFTLQQANQSYSYTFRKQFHKVVKRDLINIGDNEIKPLETSVIQIGYFDIAKAYFEQSELEGQKASETGKAVMEKVECTQDLPKLGENILTLCDYCGNMYEPEKLVKLETVNVSTRVQWINDHNIRAYMSALPICGEWNDGDEVVTSTDTYRYIDGYWYKVFALADGIKHNSSGKLEPIGPLEPLN